ncbi:gag_pre-integrs domain-containing protein/UBN2_3 domain-containing protein [Cephalotus follicularis]|uniref:Gag_pre-integrs domain-containing protein/UBN2_3 domain-containing protein n=1 Tax=Cephalotus follicularis TaxID=3775 RepID=A0A1Q3BSQ7_CEPFO|nr:gag_pre-integrs domain-containing protein/UBN2_3 domain-containing protein [Cephalotus follicularis]
MEPKEDLGFSGTNGSSHVREVPALPVCPIKLDGTSYLIWSRSVFLAIGARGFSGFLIGASKKPAEQGDTQNKWVTTNYLSMSYIINSMEPTVARGYLLMDSTIDIWISAEKTFSKKKNTSQCYEIRKWHELDYYGTFNAINPVDAVTFQEWQDNHRLFDFLAGLNVEFEPIRAQILSTKPLPSLEDALSSIQSEDTRRAVMALPAPQERSALYSDSTTVNVAFRGKTSGAQARPTPVCDYCGKEKHTRDRCWKLHGRPGDKKKSQHSLFTTANSAIVSPPTGRSSSATTPLPFTPDQMQVLRNLFTKEHIPSSSDMSTTSAMSITGPSDSVSGDHFCDLNTLRNSWIIDTGATDHMTSTSSKFVSFVPSPSLNHVTTTDGSCLPISCCGTIQFFNFSLPSVLLVPKLTINLLSISSLTKQLNCKVTFSPTYCIFQELVSGHTIGKGTTSGGLYLLDETPSIMASHATATSTSSSLAEIKRWHHRLGHPPFSVLSSLLLTLCRQIKSEMLVCESCIFGRQTRTIYPVSNSRILRYNDLRKKMASVNCDPKPFIYIHSILRYIGPGHT